MTDVTTADTRTLARILRATSLDGWHGALMAPTAQRLVSDADQHWRQRRSTHKVEPIG